MGSVFFHLSADILLVKAFNYIGSKSDLTLVCRVEVWLVEIEKFDT